jgi:hypothetical protein
MHPREFRFETTIEREDSDLAVAVYCRVESVAQSVGFDEPCRQREVTIIRTEYRGNVPLTDEEEEFLLSKAVDQLSYH